MISLRLGGASVLVRDRGSRVEADDSVPGLEGALNAILDSQEWRAGFLLETQDPDPEASFARWMVERLGAEIVKDKPAVRRAIPGRVY